MKKAVVIHSGGMDSSICLALACQEFGKERVASLTFIYDQRHLQEVRQAKKICADWGVDHKSFEMPDLGTITSNALLNKDMDIVQAEGEAPNTLVVGRNGLMARLGAIYAHSLQASAIYMGIMQLEEANSGYRDCSRAYMNLKEKILQIDLDDPAFVIKTPLVAMTKKETMDLAHQLGILSYLLKETITCYESIAHAGCGNCPACKLRNKGVQDFLKENPDFVMPYLF